MTRDEMILYANEYANKRAYFVYQKLPYGMKGLLEINDLAQNMLEVVIKYLDSYDAAKGEFKPWVHTVINNQGTDDIVRYKDQSIK